MTTLEELREAARAGRPVWFVDRDGEISPTTKAWIEDAITDPDTRLDRYALTRLAALELARDRIKDLVWNRQKELNELHERLTAANEELARERAGSG